MNVLSIPDRLDKAVGIYGTRQKAIKALTGGLSEKHILASLAGEMLVPDTIDLVTLGLGYIPRRVLLKGPKMVKAFLKSRASRLPKYARKVDDVAPAGSKYASQAWTPHQDNAYPRNKNGKYITTNFFFREANIENVQDTRRQS